MQKVISTTKTKRHDSVFLAYVAILYSPDNELWLDLALFGVIGFFVYPTILLLVVSALDFTSKKAVGTAAGLIGLFAYLGRVIEGKGIMATTVSTKPQSVYDSGEAPVLAQAELSADNLSLDHPARLVLKAPFFASRLGAAYCGDSLEMLKALPSASVNLVVTSPPYALHFKKAYGNEHKDRYVKWFLPFAKEIQRVLTDDGSFVLNIGGSGSVLILFRYLTLVLCVFGIAIPSPCQEKLIYSVSQFEKTAPSSFVLQVIRRTEKIPIHYVPKDNARPLTLFNHSKILFPSLVISDRWHTQVISAEFRDHLRLSREQKHPFRHSFAMPVLRLFRHLGCRFYRVPFVRGCHDHGRCAAMIFSFHSEQSREFFVSLNGHYYPRALGVYDSLSVQKSAFSGIASLSRLPSDDQKGQQECPRLNSFRPSERVDPIWGMFGFFCFLGALASIVWGDRSLWTTRLSIVGFLCLMFFCIAGHIENCPDGDKERYQRPVFRSQSFQHNARIVPQKSLDTI